MRRASRCRRSISSQVGEIYFVRDGHHRVSVLAALGRTDIDAYVTEVITRVDAERAINAHRPAAQEPRARVLRAGAAARGRAREIDAVGSVGLRGARPRASRRGDFGRCGPRRAARPQDDRRTVAGDRVPPGGRDAARGGPDRRPDRDRGLHAHRRRALQAAAHAHMERRRPPAGGRGQRRERR